MKELGKREGEKSGEREKKRDGGKKEKIRQNREREKEVEDQKCRFYVVNSIIIGSFRTFKMIFLKLIWQKMESFLFD